MEQIHRIGYDILAPNFDDWLLGKYHDAPTAKLAQMPDAIARKMKQSAKKNRFSSLKFAEKALVAQTVFGANVFIVIQDEDNGLDNKAFIDALRAQKEGGGLKDLVEDLKAQGVFILAGEDVCRNLHYIRNQLAGPTFNLIRNYRAMVGKSRLASREAQMDVAFNGIIEFIKTYENAKKLFTAQADITMAMFYGLLHFHWKDSTRAEFEQEFKNAPSSNSRHLSQALTELTRRGYIERVGAAASSKYKIKAKGTELLSKIIGDYVLSKQRL